jgi:hypothetical protein
MMQQPLGSQPRIEAQSRHQIGQRGFENARADPVLDALLRRPLDDDAIDPCLPQRMPEQESGRPGTDNGDLGFQNCRSSISSTR